MLTVHEGIAANKENNSLIRTNKMLLTDLK